MDNFLGVDVCGVRVRCVTTQVTSRWRQYAEELARQADKLIPVAECLRECGSQQWKSEALDAWSVAVCGHSDAVVEARRRFLTTAAALQDHADAVDAVLSRICDARAAVMAEIARLEESLSDGAGTARLAQLRSATADLGVDDVRWVGLAGMR